MDASVVYSFSYALSSKDDANANAPEDVLLLTAFTIKSCMHPLGPLEGPVALIGSSLWGSTTTTYLQRFALLYAEAGREHFAEASQELLGEGLLEHRPPSAETSTAVYLPLKGSKLGSGARKPAKKETRPTSEATCKTLNDLRIRNQVLENQVGLMNINKHPGTAARLCKSCIASVVT